ncbi:tannase [Aspergillus heterothallicus]
MKGPTLTLLAGVLLSGNAASSSIPDARLTEACTASHVLSSIPDSAAIGSLVVDPSSITANTVFNVSFPDTTFYPAATISFCNVTLAYSHLGKNDQVRLQLWLPQPSEFQNRWLSTGGGGFALNSGEEDLPGGVQYGAVSGITDGGFGGFSVSADQVFLLANGTIDYDVLYMFGYKAHYELTTIGKAFTRSFYGMKQDERLYAYYQGCSDGGRQGYSQVQRYADDWDGAVIAAPAVRFAHQKINHLYAAVVEQTMGYVPPPCEMDKILNLTIAACDALDGRRDGVVARTDLCKLHFNVSSTLGASYSCPGTLTGSVELNAASTIPAQAGNVSAEGVALARALLTGLKTLDGRAAYFWYQPSTAFTDAIPTNYNASTEKYAIPVESNGAKFVTRFLELLDIDPLSPAAADNVLRGATYDTLVNWIALGWQRYEDTLQTSWPDLTPFASRGGKIIHIHGESDASISSQSSVLYHEAMRKIMYPSLSFDESTRAMSEWNRLFLIPGGGHCAASATQPNGGWPRTTLETLIRWVEGGRKPEKLDAVVQIGEKKGEEQKLCAWPRRPLWTRGGKIMKCVFDQESFHSWLFESEVFKMPLY